MASLSRMTDYQYVISDIVNYKYTEEEQKWIEDNIGPPLTENQIRDMYQRFHLHLSEDEKGEGFKKTKENKRNTSKDLLPKSLMPLLDEATPLKKRWSLFCKTLWWCHLVRHIEVDESIWNLGEKLLAEYPNGRKAIMIDVKESIRQRQIVLNQQEKENENNILKV